jgi:hypothetical protein
MLIKVLSDVSTKNEKVVLTKVRWKKLPAGNHPASIVPQGAPEKDRARITAIWSRGCSIVTETPLLPGQNLWLKAANSSGKVILVAVATVVWTQGSFSRDGYRAELRFRSSGKIENQNLSLVPAALNVGQSHAGQVAG